MNIINKIENILKEGGISEYKPEARLILTAVLNLSLEEIYCLKDINIDKAILIAKKRIETRIPIQYLLNEAYFMGEKYTVNENVLIPRDETELLVLECFNRLKNKKGKINILDIGLGSGCISCALALKMKNYDIEILGVDISSNALITALDNITRLNLEKKVTIRKSDLFSKIRDIEKFDLIVSNPPYIPYKIKNTLDKELDFEPKEALYAYDNEGVEFYKKIIKEAPDFLKKQGIIAFELGVNQDKIVYNILKEKFYDINITADLGGINRVISAKIL